MKIANYVFNAAEESINYAVREVMELFKISPADTAIRTDDTAVVYIQTQTKLENCEIVVTTHISFWRDARQETWEEINREYCLGQEFKALEKRLLKKNLLILLRRLTGLNPTTWGILRGVRPTKLIHKLLDAGVSGTDIEKILATDYLVDRDKAELAAKIALHQRPFLNTSLKKISIYVGIPYCPSKCLYCSFPSYLVPGREQVSLFLDVLEKELQATKEMMVQYGLSIENIYIGGGTPTSLASKDFERLLCCVKNSFSRESTMEFTVEAGRPDSITPDKIELFSQYNVTRVSVNPQTMQEKTLKYIGRMHTVRDIIDVFQKIRHKGIPVINMDIIAGLPGESPQDFLQTLEKIAWLQPDNLTIHTLALKKGSILKTNLLLHSLPDEQATEKMLYSAREYIRNMNMKPYYLYRQKYMTGNFENIGYAKPGTECLYNIQSMEERQSIIGHGPAASTKIVNVSDWSLESCHNPKDLHSYIYNIDSYIAGKRRLLERTFTAIKSRLSEGDNLC